MILAIITAWLAYKRAKQAGRNAILWALAGAAVYIGTQLVVSFALGLALGFAILFFKWPRSTLDTATIPLTIAAIVASFFTSWLLLKYLDSLPRVDQAEPSPYSISGQ